jgi:hypothetical protein
MTETPQQIPPWWTDPTENVKALVEADRKRQDDLRQAEAGHVRELLQRDREHARELRVAESERINAILAENAGTVRRTSEVQLAQQQALAAQVAASAVASAETLRTSLAPIQSRLDELSRAQYETQGQKQQVTETRNVRSGTQLNINVLVGVAGVVIALITLYLYATKR